MLILPLTLDSSAFGSIIPIDLGKRELEFPVDVTIETLAQHTIVHVNGEVDLANAPELDLVLAETVATKPVAIVVDLSTVTFMDSTGLGVLVRTFKRCQESGIRLDLIVTNERVLKVLAITGLDTVLPIHSSIESIS